MAFGRAVTEGIFKPKSMAAQWTLHTHSRVQSVVVYKRIMQADHAAPVAQILAGLGQQARVVTYAIAAFF
jgi:hypothetical protein